MLFSCTNWLHRYTDSQIHDELHFARYELGLVNNDVLSDITFIVEGQPVNAHKVLCMRCTYFKAMLTGTRIKDEHTAARTRTHTHAERETPRLFCSSRNLDSLAFSFTRTGGMRESEQREIVLPDVRYEIFLRLMEYLYTDQVDIPLDMAMELLQAADQFGVDRLKKMCESKMLASITVDNAASIFHAADTHNAKSLREKCLNFILANFDPVTKTPAFVEMGRDNVDLVFEVLQKRS